MRLYIITKRNLISIGFCLLIGVLAGAIAVTSTVRAVQSAAAQREIPIYYVDTDKKQVALSFDAAWGNEQTEHLLEILDKYKVKSTFFLVGDWVKNYPDSVKDIAKHGHDVGNHSNTHPIWSVRFSPATKKSRSLRAKLPPCSVPPTATTTMML